jgi:hypothetical protein
MDREYAGADAWGGDEIVDRKRERLTLAIKTSMNTMETLERRLQEAKDRIAKLDAQKAKLVADMSAIQRKLHAYSTESEFDITVELEDGTVLLEIINPQWTMSELHERYGGATLYLNSNLLPNYGDAQFYTFFAKRGRQILRVAHPRPSSYPPADYPVKVRTQGIETTVKINGNLLIDTFVDQVQEALGFFPGDQVFIAGMLVDLSSKEAINVVLPSHQNVTADFTTRRR